MYKISACTLFLKDSPIAETERDNDYNEASEKASKQAWAGHNPSDYCSPKHPRQD